MLPELLLDGDVCRVGVHFEYDAWFPKKGAMLESGKIGRGHIPDPELVLGRLSTSPSQQSPSRIIAVNTYRVSSLIRVC